MVEDWAPLQSALLQRIASAFCASRGLADTVANAIAAVINALEKNIIEV